MERLERKGGQESRQQDQDSMRKVLGRGSVTQPASGGAISPLISGSTRASTVVDGVPAAAGGTSGDKWEQKPDLPPIHKKPSFIKFEELAAVKRLVSLWIKKEIFCFSSVKRAMKSFLAGREGREIFCGMEKPDCNSV